MELGVSFCPFLASIQGCLLQFFDESTNSFQLQDEKSREEFLAYLHSSIKADSVVPASSLLSLHNLLLLSTGLVPAPSDDNHIQSALDKLHSAHLPPAAYLYTLSIEHLEQRLVEVMTAADPSEATTLCQKLTEACTKDAVWPAVHVVLNACVTVGGSVDEESRRQAVFAAAMKLVAFTVSALKAEPPSVRAVLALARCLLVLQTADFASANNVATNNVQTLSLNETADCMSTLLSDTIEAAQSLFQRITLNSWLEWAEVPVHSALPEDGNAQSAVAASLQRLRQLCEESQLQELAQPLTPQLQQLLQTCEPFAPAETLSLQQRCAALDGCTTEPARRRHLHHLISSPDTPSEAVTERLEQHCTLLTMDGLAKLASMLQAKPELSARLRDRLIKVLVGELLTRSRTSALNSLIEAVLSAPEALTCSDWELQLRTVTAQMVGSEQSAKAAAGQLAELLLQRPRQLLATLVQQAADSAGKAALLAAVLPELHRRLPLTLLRNGQRGLFEALVLEQLATTCEPQPFEQLARLLTAGVAAGVVPLDAALAEAVAALPATSATRCQNQLLLIQSLLSAGAAGADGWCCRLAELCTDALDRTLDVDEPTVKWEAAAETAEVRARAVRCLTLMRRQTSVDVDERLAELAGRVHPLTELYLARCVLDLPAPPDVHLLHCLAEADTPDWSQDQHTILTATLASYLPHLCAEEWQTVHQRLVHYHSGAPYRPETPEGRPLARVAWYYCDLVTLWTAPMDGQPETESLVLSAPRLLHCLRQLSRSIKRSLEQMATDDSYGTELSSVFLPLTHVLTLVASQLLREPVEMLCTFVCTQFVQMLVSRMSTGEASEESTDTHTRPARGPCADWQLDQMDTSAGVLSQFVVGCFNIPNDSPIKKRILSHISGTVLQDMVQNAPQTAS